MKRNFLLFPLLMLPFLGRSQLTIQSGASLVIQTGAIVTVQGDVNSQADIQGSGLLLMKGTSLQDVNMNGFTIPNLEIDNTSLVSLSGSAIVTGNMQFTGGKLLLNNNTLRLATAAGITGYDNTKYIVTNGTGQLVKASLGSTAFEFPIGYDAVSYNPVSISQQATAEDIGVRCLQNVLTAGTGGNVVVKEVVDASWVISESVAGNNDLTLTATWNGTDELNGFNRNKTGISRFDGVTWDMTNAMTGAASGTGPYSSSRANITGVGTFAVGTRPVLTPLLFAPKLYLQGPAFAGGLMSDGLRAAGVIPLTEPYSGLSNFSQSGSGGGESIPSSLLAATGTGSDIVDWVFAELRDGSSGAIISTRSVLLQRDGAVVDLDGSNTKTPYINFAGELPASYYIAIRHRNTLGARTNATVALSKTTAAAFDYTASLAQSYAGSVSNDALATIATGVFGLWGGNANSDLFARRTGSASVNDYSLLLNYLGANTVVSGVYRREDFNMDGTVRRTGSASVNDYSKLLSILGAATIIFQPVY